MSIIKTGLTFLTFAAFSIEALSGTLFTKNRYGDVFSYDTDTGSLIDSFPVMTYGNGGIAASTDRLFIGNGYRLEAFTHDGDALYLMDGFSHNETGIAYGDGKVFSTDGLMIYVTDAQTGTRLDTFPSMGGMLNRSSFAYNGGKLFTKNSYGNMFSYDTDTGSLIDSFGGMTYGNGGIAASADQIFVSNSYRLEAFTHDGEPSYLMDGFSDDESGIAYGDGKVFSTDGLMIYVTDAQTGTRLDTFPSMAGMLRETSFAYVPSANEVPVPAAAWLFGSALAGLSVIRRKK